MPLTKLFLGGNNDVMYKLFPPRESLVSDIPAGDGNIKKLFYGVGISWFLNFQDVNFWRVDIVSIFHMVKMKDVEFFYLTYLCGPQIVF